MATTSGASSTITRIMSLFRAVGAIVLRALSVRLFHLDGSRVALSVIDPAWRANNMMTIRTTLPPRAAIIGWTFRAVSRTGRSTWIIHRTTSSTGSPSTTMGSATLPICSSSFRATRPHLFMRGSCLSVDSSSEGLASSGGHGNLRGAYRLASDVHRGDRISRASLR